MEREIVETLREWAKNANDQGVVEAVNGLRSAADEIEQLRQQLKELRGERDEARRRLCEIYCANDTDWLSGPFPMETSTPQMFAKLNGWDCFARDTSEHL